MPLLTSEIDRIRWELNTNLLKAGAEPYVSVMALFDQLIQPYLREGSDTTSSTAVTAVAAGAKSSPVSLALLSATGFSPGQTVIVDVDDRREEATVQALSGAAITVLLRLDHSGTYPVMAEGGLSIVRNLLRRLRLVDSKLGGVGIDSAGIKKIDEIEFRSDTDPRTSLVAEQDRLREQLATALLGTRMRLPGTGMGGGGAPLSYESY